MPVPLPRRRILAFLAAPFLVSACSTQSTTGPDKLGFLSEDEPPLYPNETPQLRALINKYADHYEVPRQLVHRVVIRESTHRPKAINRPYYGLMQILPATARSMGFRGEPKDLLDAETNLKYAVKYLRGAYMVAGGDQTAAVQWYARGYYYEAKKLGLLEETGLV